MANYNDARAETFNITHFLIRLVVGAVVLAITAALTPGFAITGIWPLIFGAVILSALDYLALRVLGVNATPFGRGITGFILAAVIIYITQFFVGGYNVNIVGAIIGALIYGIIDAVIPGRAM
ncbi:MAG: phage holin family protein [Bacillota bacterium]